MQATAENTPRARICEALPEGEPERFWREISSRAKQVYEEEVELRPLLDEVILSQPDFAHSLASRLARKLAREDMPHSHLMPLLTDILSDAYRVTCAATADLIAINQRDPACQSVLDPLLYFKGYLAITVYRVSHRLWNDGRRHLALYFQGVSSEVFGVDIHPAARIGCGIMLDHGTSFVVGETAIIEDDVSILHEVTLGGTGKETGHRHPIVRSGVMLGAGAKVLGRVEIGEGAKVGAGSVVLADVPPHVTVAGVPAQVVGQTDAQNPAHEMDQTLCSAKDLDRSLSSSGL